MGNKGDKLDKIHQDIDQLKGMVRRVLANQKDLKKSGLEVTPQKQAAPKYPEGATVGEIKSELPDKFLDMLTFKDKQGYVRVEPRDFLGTDNFAKIAEIIREIGGDYISAGKDSHFRVPK